jgi:hypothetical protein
VPFYEPADWGRNQLIPNRAGADLCLSSCRDIFAVGRRNDDEGRAGVAIDYRLQRRFMFGMVEKAKPENVM